MLKYSEVHSAILEIQLRGKVLRFHTPGDYYPITYYEDVANDLWEPHTVAFLERHVTNQTLFIDVGAATGITTLFAAALGARVVAFEPNPFVFNSLVENIKLNGAGGQVEVQELALSDHNDLIHFNADSDPEVISRIAVTGGEAYKNHEVKVRSIDQVLSELSLPFREHGLMKMDIEGAEYRILSNPTSMSAISMSCSKLIFSLHPGFTFKQPGNKLLRLFLVAPRFVIVFKQHVEIFRVLKRLGSLEIYGMRKVSNPLLFAVLVSLGMRDWVLSFR